MERSAEQALYREKIAGLKDLAEAFELVKSAVLQRFRMHRAGMSIALQVMPGSLGGYHVAGSNAIVLNSYVLAAVKNSAGSPGEYNSYVFMVLAHEYLHSLGVFSETAARQMTFELCSWMFGQDHMATRMAKQDPSSLYPQLRALAEAGTGQDFRPV